jgi:tetratricopeptide (TPR) repeat protein
MEFGEENISAAVILNSMGLLYKKQGKFERSIDAYNRALKVREEELGEDHPDCVATRHNIAELYIQWAKPDKAKEILERNIAIMEERNAKDQAELKDKMKEAEELDEGKKMNEKTYF